MLFCCSCYYCRFCYCYLLFDDIIYCYKFDDTLPTDFKDLCEMFKKLLRKIPQNRKLILFIDSLDQLSHEFIILLLLFAVVCVVVIATICSLTKYI